MDKSRISLRPVTKTEHTVALDLWGSVFPVGRKYFEQYYDSDPWYVEGDTLGAWDNSGRLVSAVHVCRRPLAWAGGSSLWCGGIANVATLPDYRGQGLSGELLTAAIEHMKECGMQISLLGTGLPAHYARFGWEPLQLPTCEVALAAEDAAAPIVPLAQATVSAEIVTLYNSSPRPLQLERSVEYFEGWVGARWRESDQQMLVIPGRGYAVTELPKDDSSPACAAIIEYRALDGNAEREVLLQAIRHLAPHPGRVRLHAVPQYGASLDLMSNRLTVDTTDSGTMIRNVSLEPGEYAQIRDIFVSGRGIWWPSDSF